MCGIVGFVGGFSSGELERMKQSIAHRGPDQEGLWYDAQNGIGFGFRRLAIIDLHPRGSQPMWDAQRRAVIVFNGEIYNYRELRDGLLRDGFTFNSQTDTEVVLNLYLRDGTQFVKKLNGMFAFAIWDVARKEVIAARDGLGVKPLYYTQTPRGFAFASEIRALLQLNDIDTRLDEAGIGDWLGYSFTPAPRTVLKAVRKLRPGFMLRMKHGGEPQDHCFYLLPYEQEIARISPSEAVEELRHRLDVAVKRQMVADVEIGAFLSGGIDSTTLAHYGRSHSVSGRLQCFTIGVGGHEASDGFVPDLPFAELVANHLKLPLHTIQVKPDMLQDIDKMIYHVDEPCYDPAALSTYYICQNASAHGIKVLLSGTGGDDIFSGYRRHVALHLERLWGWSPTATRTMLRKVTQRIANGSARGRRISKLFRHADRSDVDRLISYYLWLDEPWVDEIVAAAHRGKPRGWSIEGAFRSSLAWLPPDTPPLNKMLFLDTRHFLADHNLHYTDKMSMACGVEVRVPFLDPDLVAFAARLPIHVKQNGQVGKWILREAVRPFVPPAVLNRSKSGFGVPLRDWMKGSMKQFFDERLDSDEIRRSGIFDPAGVKRLRREVEEGRVDGAYTLLAIICLQSWKKQFIESRTVVNGLS